ncbi:MAG TPA: sarcosine oxidase subunit gamma family protein, partial [Capillimicrobium sp.]
PAAQVGLRVDPAAERGAAARLGEALGAPLPVAPNTVALAAGGGRRALWLGPDEWLVVDDTAAPARLVAELEAAAGDAFASVVDLSSNRVVLELAGPQARAVLESAITIDLHPRAFADGACAQTLLAAAQVIVERAGQAFRVYARPSFAPYVTGWLEDAVSGDGGSSGSPSSAR